MFVFGDGAHTVHVPSREMISGHSFSSFILLSTFVLYCTSPLYINGTQQVLIFIFLVSEIKDRCCALLYFVDVVGFSCHDSLLYLGKSRNYYL